MADFDPPFAENGIKTAPSSSLQSDGFVCGPADPNIFNFLFNVLQGEIGNVIGDAGLVPDAGDLSQLSQAVVVLASQAGGLVKIGAQTLGADATNSTTVYANAYSHVFAPLKGANPRLIIGSIQHSANATGGHQSSSTVKLTRTIGAGAATDLQERSHIADPYTVANITSTCSIFLFLDTADAGGDSVTYKVDHKAGGVSETSTVKATSNLLIFEIGKV